MITVKTWENIIIERCSDNGDIIATIIIFTLKFNEAFLFPYYSFDRLR